MLKKKIPGHKFDDTHERIHHSNETCIEGDMFTHPNVKTYEQLTTLDAERDARASLDYLDDEDDPLDDRDLFDDNLDDDDHLGDMYDGLDDDYDHESWGEDDDAAHDEL